MVRGLSGAVGLMLGAFVAGCGSLPAVRAPARGQGIGYEVAVSRDGATLVVEARVPPGVPPYFGVATGAVRYVQDLHVAVDDPRRDDDGDDWTRVAATDTFYWLPDCSDHGCRIRYRFALGAAARGLADVDRARVVADGVVESPPSTWLLRPIGLAHAPYRLHVLLNGDVKVASGLFPASGRAPLTYEGDVADLRLAPYTAIGRFETVHVVDSSRGIDLDVAVPAAFGDRLPDIESWALRSASVVADYYGAFPVPHALVVVAEGEDKDGVSHGRTLGNGGAASVVWLGPDVTSEALRDDWVLPHELVHMALPSVKDDRHRWFEEGVATYVEGVARARAGDLPEEAFWATLLDGLPKGLPHRGDRGLDHTPTWGRRYWGGALFCFLADMEIRRQSQGRATLADALRGVSRTGGNVSVGWTLERILATGDAAVGLSVLSNLHDRMGTRPMPVDLGALWTRLGVRIDEGRVVLDDDAPLSALRRSLTRADERE
ncbi:MAG: hypothetical protein U0235_01575 [Polyangiaceae bacterium]